MGLHVQTAAVPQAARAVVPVVPPAAAGGWRQGLPVLRCDGFTLRELRHADAPMLLTLLTTSEVTRFISPPPATLEGFERFIAWSERERQAGRYASYGIVPDGYDAPVGLFQVRQLEPGFETAEWGFALAAEFWGFGYFAKGAAAVLEFAFEVLGVRRVEARSVVHNNRGNAALRKIGAIQEGVLRKSFLRNGKHLDQALWAILAEDWYRSKAVWGARTR